MTETQITQKRKLEDLKHSLALSIRQMLDAYAEKYTELGGEEEWIDVEQEVSEMVFGE